MVKIFQFADDIILFLSDKDSVMAVLKLLQDFAIFSGLRINLSKTQLIKLGKDFDLQIDGVMVQSRIEILSIVYSYDRDSINLNFQKLVDKANNNIKCWYSRHLTLYGHVLLVKCLICSLLQYIG